MTEFYYRYTMTENQIFNDVKRGYGFRYYDLYTRITDLIDKSPFIEQEPKYYSHIYDVDFSNMEIDDILETLHNAGILVRQDIYGTNKWGLSYNGLSSFGPYEDMKEAKDEALTWHYNGFDGQIFDYVVLVEAEATDYVDDNDMETINVTKIWEVVHKEKLK